MPTRYWADPDHLYFITGTLIKWLNLFTIPDISQIILDSFTWNRNENRFLLFAYVIMPSHIHAIIKPLNQRISESLQAFSSFTAHAIVKKLVEINEMESLEVMRQEKSDSRSKYSVWQAFHSENIFNEKFLNQKLEYIHSNPVKKDVSLLSGTDYQYSSASFYELGKQGMIEVDDNRDYLLKFEMK